MTSLYLPFNFDMTFSSKLSARNLDIYTSIFLNTFRTDLNSTSSAISSTQTRVTMNASSSRSLVAFVQTVSIHCIGHFLETCAAVTVKTAWNNCFDSLTFVCFSHCSLVDTIFLQLDLSTSTTVECRSLLYVVVRPI